MKNTFLLLFLFFSLFLNAQKKENYEKFVDSMMQIGQKEKLIPYFQKKLKTNPKSEMTLRVLGFLHMQNNDHEIAEKYYRRALTINPKCGICYDNIGQIYVSKNENTKATQYFDTAIIVEPNNANLYTNRAEFKVFMGNKIGAMSDYNKAILLEPKKAQFYNARAKFNSNENYLTLAMIDYDMTIALEPENYSYYLARSEVFYNQGKSKEAIKDIDTAIELDSRQEAAYTARGTIHASLGDYEKANLDFSKGIELNSRGYFAYYNRSKVKYKLEDMNGSCDDLSKTLALLNQYNPKNELKAEIENSIANYCDDSKSSYYFQRGIAFYNLGKYDESIAIYTKGLEKFPTNAMSLSFRGNAYYESKKYEKAILDYNAAIVNKENLIIDIQENQQYAGLNNEIIQKYYGGFVATIYLTMAQSYFALGKYEEALLEIEKGIQIAPDLKEFGIENYYNVRGSIYIALGQFQKAIADFDKCLQLKLSLPIAYINRAVAKINLKNNYKIISQSCSGGFNNQFFNANWNIPLKTKIERGNANLLSALQDCNQAIKEDPDLGYAYYIRGQIKRLLEYDDYCNDLHEARKLKYQFDTIYTSNCIK